MLAKLLLHSRLTLFPVFFLLFSPYFFRGVACASVTMEWTLLFFGADKIVSMTLANGKITL
jgi:hypothetical protein